MAQDIHEISIVLSARSHNPTLLTFDFLKGSGVIPGDWELARPPVLTVGSAQVIFKNGVNIVANSQTVTFSEAVTTKAFENVEVAKIARKYVATLPNLDYQAVGINPKRFIPFEEQPEQAHKYITETILSSGAWQNFGIAPMQAGINLVYTLERCQLRLGINEARLRFPDRDTVPALLFAGNFYYDVTGDSAEERLQNIERSIENWQRDIATYQELIDSQFLAGVKGNEIPIRDAVSVIPVAALKE
ncbi:MAG TPA: hypothetical protein DCY88_34800 [Cyanobacteria bacterium UBA11372]|nr:hypothetical protein [Cyanobacteria bacterium UBA11372]